MKLSRTLKPREKRPVKILQVGEGNFLRGFLDWQIQLLNEQTDFNGGIAVVQPRRSQKIAPLNEQNGLYTLRLQGISNGQQYDDTTIVDAVQYGINLEQDYEQYVALAHSEDLRFVVSNSTEAGIFVDKEERFEQRPQKTFPGKLLALLVERFDYFNGDNSKGLIMIPTELIEKNGETLKAVLVQLATNWNLSDAFKIWLIEANTFCNTLVDRIVPGYSEEKAAELPYEDTLFVVAEPYSLFAIEGPDFVFEELPLHKLKVNAFLTNDLTPYRTQKVRILNGSHTALTPLAMLSGIQTVAEAVEDPVLGPFLEAFIFEEVVPTIDHDPQQVEAFAKDVLDRFRNPFIAHYVESISLNALDKFVTRNVPTLKDYTQKYNAVPKRLVLAFAALLAVHRPINQIPLNDDVSKVGCLQAVWHQVENQTITLSEAVQKMLSEVLIWKEDLTEINGLALAVTEALNLVGEVGVEQTIIHYTTSVIQ